MPVCKLRPQKQLISYIVKDVQLLRPLDTLYSKSLRRHPRGNHNFEVVRTKVYSRRCKRSLMHRDETTALQDLQILEKKIAPSDPPNYKSKPRHPRGNHNFEVVRTTVYSRRCKRSLMHRDETTASRDLQMLETGC